MNPRVSRSHELVAELAAYLHTTDNSSASQSGKIVSFYHRERGRRHGTELVVLPTAAGRSRVDLYHGPCLVA